MGAFDVLSRPAYARPVCLTRTTTLIESGRYIGISVTFIVNRYLITYRQYLCDIYA